MFQGARSRHSALTTLPFAAHSAFHASQPFMRGISTHTDATREG